MRPLGVVLLLPAIVAVACTSARAVMREPSRTSMPGSNCTTSALKGRCGPYDSYRRITSTTSDTYVGNNVWNPVDGSRQVLSTKDPGDWQVMARMPAGNTAVVSYPSIDANYGRIQDLPTPLAAYSAIRSSFRENMHAVAGTSAWAAYDIWLGASGCSPAAAKCGSHEVMVQHDFAGNAPCSSVGTATFGGSAGIPVRSWHLCEYGTELIWKLGVDEQHRPNMRSGKVDLLPMLTWLVRHGYLPAGTGLWSIGYGWEICSTGGAYERFAVSHYSMHPIYVRREG